MQPYQEASEATRRSGEGVTKLAKYAGAGVASAAGGKLASVLAGRVGALLSPYISEGMFSKGLEKIDPRFGKFIKGALEEGYDIEEIKDFIGEKVKKTQGVGHPQEKGNIVAQYSPELHQFILDQLQQGRSPVEAGALAQLESKGARGFKSVIDKITKDHKAPWSAILQTVYGQGQESPQSQASQGSHPAQQQGGQGQQALMEVLQKLQQMRSR
jgi:hypothetical protein